MERLARWLEVTLAGRHALADPPPLSTFKHTPTASTTGAGSMCVLHHVHAQDLSAGLADAAADRGPPQPLVRLEAVAARKAVVHPLDQQHVDLHGIVCMHGHGMVCMGARVAWGSSAQGRGDVLATANTARKQRPPLGACRPDEQSPFDRVRQRLLRPGRCSPALAARRPGWTPSAPRPWRNLRGRGCGRVRCCVNRMRMCCAARLNSAAKQVTRFAAAVDAPFDRVRPKGRLMASTGMSRMRGSSV